MPGRNDTLYSVGIGLMGRLATARASRMEEKDLLARVSLSIAVNPSDDGEQHRQHDAVIDGVHRHGGEQRTTPLACERQAQGNRHEHGRGEQALRMITAKIRLFPKALTVTLVLVRQADVASRKCR